LSFLALTIPFSLLLAGVLLALVLRAAKQGQFDDWEGPAFRHLYDDDRVPEARGSSLANAEVDSDGDDGDAAVERPLRLRSRSLPAAAEAASRADG